jgi:uncharacterized protein (DUF4415 family)
MKKEYDFSRGKRGAVIKPVKGKTRITIRLDDDILEAFKEMADESGGGSYQTMINAALRQYLESKREPLERTLRRVIRDELARVSS